MKKIGILGGISYVSTLEYYRTLHELYYERQGDYYYPEMAVESLNFQYFTDLENEGRRNEYRDYIVRGMKNLEAAGAELVLMAANSPHSVLREVGSRVSVPILSIVEAVGREAVRLGLKKLFLTGIRYTMQESFYPEGLSGFGIEVLVPSREEQEEIDAIIFGELTRGLVTPASRARFLEIISVYPADGVILGCTELPRLVNEEDTDRILLDSLRIHCREVMKYVCGT